MRWIPTCKSRYHRTKTGQPIEQPTLQTPGSWRRGLRRGPRRGFLSAGASRRPREAAAFQLQARFDLDYIKITRSCEELLYAIYVAAAEHMERLRYSVHQSDGIWRDGRNKTNSFQVMVHVLMELNAADSQQRRGAKGSHISAEPTTPLTNIAASVLTRFADGVGLA
jgi:hypothetical protein